MFLNKLIGRSSKLDNIYYSFTLVAMVVSRASEMFRSAVMIRKPTDFITPIYSRLLINQLIGTGMDTETLNFRRKLTEFLKGDFSSEESKRNFRRT
jgi:hypothetical protein